MYNTCYYKTLLKFCQQEKRLYFKFNIALLTTFVPAETQNNLRHVFC